MKGLVRPRFVIFWGALLLGLSNSALILLPSYLNNPALSDWPIFWKAAHLPPDIYDFARSKFPYSPTALIFLRPFALVPSWASYLLWSTAGAVALYYSGRLIARRGEVLAAFLMPATFWCLVVGQTGLFVAALAIAAVAKRSGPLFGLGVVLKPQSFVALPFTDWTPGLAAKALISAITAIAIAVALFGWELWPAWARSLPALREAVAEPGIQRLNAGMGGAIQLLGLPGWTYFLGAGIGLACTWATFRASGDPVDRYAAFACGSVLISPYAMGYDLAGLSIAAIAMLNDPRRSPARWLAAGWLACGILPSFAVLAMATVLIHEHRRSFRGARRPAALIHKV